MKPDVPDDSQSGMSLPSQGQIPARPDNENDIIREATTNVIRTQIDSLYDQQNNLDSQLSEQNPYKKTHSDNSGRAVLTKDWQEYHSAWQNYYQKYYEGFYNQKHQHSNEGKQTASGYFDKQPDSNEIFTSNEAVFDLRQKLLLQVNQSVKKIRKSRHFVPIISAVIVVLVFIFMQYNSLIASNVLAYVSPGNIDPQNIVIDPSGDNSVSPEPRLIIPKINVDVPVLYNVGNDYDSQMTAMTKGVAHFSIPGANSHPGEIGNTVISGHSSNDLFDLGDYKFIFAQLDKLAVGDAIYANYNSKRYTYTVTEKKVVKPENVSALVFTTDKPILTLITCTPLGTSTNRLLVFATQVSPDPTAANPAPTTTSSSESEMPGNAPSLLERLFGAR